MNLRRLGVLIAFLGCAGFGYWLARTAVPGGGLVRERNFESSRPDLLVPRSEHFPQTRVDRRKDNAPAVDLAARQVGALEGERVLIFHDAASMERFLERAEGKLRILSRLETLRALRVGFADRAGLDGLLEGLTIRESLVFPVAIPALPEGGVQVGAVAFRGAVLEWLGIEGERADWGSGVKVAVLDTGVSPHETLRGGHRSLELVALPKNISEWNGHGTAVASLIAGSDSLTPGVAPGVDILSIRVANDSGVSDSFLLAEGIVRAVDAGAKIINISMGSFGDSAVMRDAVAYANERGVLMVAAVGNNGIARVTYPAAYDSVIGVGAVDAMGMHMEFSNFGSAVDLVAPGYGINAAWSGDEAARVSGTSFSAPIVTGAVAALMSEKSLSARPAYDLLMANLNEGGAAGSDAQYGGGMPDVGRALSSGQPGIYDAAIASHRVLAADPSNPNGQVEVVVQNRGTEPVVNTSVKVSVGGVVSASNLTMLAPNAVATVRVPVRENWRESGKGLRIESSASLSGGMIDSKPSNDRRVEIHGAVDAN